MWVLCSKMYVSLQSIVEALDLIGVNDWRSLAFVTREKSVVFIGRINGLIVHNEVY